MSASQRAEVTMRIHLRAPGDSAESPLEAIVILLNESSICGVVTAARRDKQEVDLPLRLDVNDDERKLRALLPVLERLIGDGLITFERSL